MNLWENLVLIVGYAYAVATVWVPLVIDPSFLATPDPVHTVTVFGIGGGGGTSFPYLRPYGIDPYSTLMLIPILYLLIRYYRAEKSPVMRGQTKYLIAGITLFFAGFYVFYLQQYVGGPSLLNLFGAGGDFILLLGLRKKGFYSVTPVAETAPAVPVVYPLEEGRSYLAHDTRASFEAFTSLVKNGHEGLSITRIFPDQVRKDYGIQTTPIRWLAESKGQDAIPPADLLGLSLMVKDFFEKAKKPIVMLHGVEYLTTINGFTPVLRLIEGLSEESATKGGILILPVLPNSLDLKDEALLASETTPMPMPFAS